MTAYNNNEDAQVKQVACLRKKALKKLEGALEDLAAMQLALDAPGCPELDNARRLMGEHEVEAKLTILAKVIRRAK